MMYKILVIEDDVDIRHIIHRYFEKRNIDVIEAIDGHMGLSLINDDIDIVLLDIMMPGIDGYEVCQQIRNNYDCPIIFISALNEEENQLKAFELGADDYVSKPFLPSILYAKCHAILSRQNNYNHHIQTFGDIKIDYDNHDVWLKDEKLELTSKEYQLLKYLTQNKNQLLKREQILDAIWGYDYYGDGRAVDTYIKKLRKKLGDCSCYIRTVFKEGYIFKGGE